ncbi:hypothetical protein Cgig2_004845 [Carnegiea gigantea]|uniref:Glycolipid transfer protein domain-containing protein n=1 Tax=Carnegiea gigantea TaxID=171969 RepID=A0A9Q1QPG9_9CARY|nr:hypothetical protein Cgig2_004845 [Carnegiea gigantea]
MKRRREMEMEVRETEMRSAIEELSVLVKLNQKNSTPAAHVIGSEIHQQEVAVSSIPTKPFLSLCYCLLQVLDKIGPTMAVLRQDVYKNIQRLEMVCESDPTYSNLVEIIKKEAVERNAKKSDSCSRALVWLTRSLDFTGALLERIAMNPRGSMEQMVADSYEITLKPWHGWISAAAYKVALKLVPDSNTFINLLMAKGQDMKTLQDEINALLSLLLPLLQDTHSLLRSYGLEKFKST